METCQEIQQKLEKHMRIVANLSKLPAYEVGGLPSLCEERNELCRSLGKLLAGWWMLVVVVGAGEFLRYSSSRWTNNNTQIYIPHRRDV